MQVIKGSAFVGLFEAMADLGNFVEELGHSTEVRRVPFYKRWLHDCPVCQRRMKPLQPSRGEQDE